MTSELNVSIVGDNVVLEQGPQRITIPFPLWNELIDRVGHRTPVVDPDDGPP